MSKKRKPEPAENIEFFCPEHAPKEDTAKWQSKPIRFFVGKFVKKSFTTLNPETGKHFVEHMWVKVSGFLDNRLVGNLASEPIGETELYLGDRVEFNVKEVEDVYRETPSTVH